MNHYYVNTQAQNNGDHEVHKSTCGRLPDVAHRYDLGWHETDRSALAAARRLYSTADGCAYCCPAIHHQ